MPSTGQAVQIVITDGGSKIGLSEFKIKAAKWDSEAPLKIENLKYSSGVLTGDVRFENASGRVLEGVRFDFVSASELYKGKDAQGKDVILSRSQPLMEESPILFGDMPKGAQSEAYPVKAAGLSWKPETAQITVTAKLSGLTYDKVVFKAHPGSDLDFDANDKLLLGSHSKPAIYSADPENDSLQSIAATPQAHVVIGVNKADGTICASWWNSHDFAFYSAAGDQQSKVAEDDKTEGMNGWPNMARYDGKGNLYLGFGQTVCQIVGGKPAFVLKSAGATRFANYIFFDVAKDGSLFVGSKSDVFRFEPGGKNPKQILQGPDVKLGTIHGVKALRLDSNRYLWIADNADEHFAGRICVFDSNGKFVWTFGRAADVAPVGNTILDGQVSQSIDSIAISGDGHVYVANGEGARSVMAFTEF